MYRTGLTYLFERPHFEHSEFGTPQCYTILYITVLERGSIYIIYRLSILKSGGHSGTEREAQRVPKRHDRAGRPGDPPARCSGRRSGVRKKVFCPIYIYIYLFHRWKYSPNYTYMVGVCRRSFFLFADPYAVYHILACGLGSQHLWKSNHWALEGCLMFEECGPVTFLLRRWLQKLIR